MPLNLIYSLKQLLGFWDTPWATKGKIMEFFLCVIGMVMIVEGVPYFVFPAKMKFWVTKIMEIPETSLRRFGFSLMLLGLFLVYIGKR